LVVELLPKLDDHFFVWLKAFGATERIFLTAPWADAQWRSSLVSLRTVAASARNTLACSQFCRVQRSTSPLTSIRNLIDKWSHKEQRFAMRTNGVEE
jgi:hypothetical protein